jgi:hypothetical protein
MDTLKFLPLFDKPLVRQLLEPARWGRVTCIQHKKVGWN